MWAYRCLIAALFASLALHTPVRGQQCDPDYNQRVPFYLAEPYTAEYRERYEWADHREPATEDTRVEAQDSQGRRLARWTSADGSARSQVRDPVAGETITWNTHSTKAKVGSTARPSQSGFPVGGVRIQQEISIRTNHHLVYTNLPVRLLTKAKLCPAEKPGEAPRRARALKPQKWIPSLRFFVLYPRYNAANYLRSKGLKNRTSNDAS
jgi:hypothetical protein